MHKCTSSFVDVWLDVGDVHSSSVRIFDFDFDVGVVACAGGSSVVVACDGAKTEIEIFINSRGWIIFVGVCYVIIFAVVSDRCGHHGVGSDTSKCGILCVV